MSSGAPKRVRKQNYLARAQSLVEKYSKVLIVSTDHVGSRQLMHIRKNLRGQAVILMGKNTLMRKAVRAVMETQPAMEGLFNLIRGNVGLVFTDGDLLKVRDAVVALKVGAPAKAGTFAPKDVVVPKGPTGLDPQQTGFLQALDIDTRIVKMQIEIQRDVKLITKGDKVGPSEAALLQKLNIFPFEYGVEVLSVYDEGDVYPASLLDLTESDVIGKFAQGVQTVAKMSLALGVTTLASVPHSIVNGYAKVMAIAMECGISIPGTIAEQYQQYLEDPDAFNAANPAPSDAGGDGDDGDEAQEEEEEEEEDDFSMGGLFG